MSKETLADTFLNQLKKEELPVSVFLVNGIKLHGVIDDFDDKVILLKSASVSPIDPVE